MEKRKFGAELWNYLPVIEEYTLAGIENLVDYNDYVFKRSQIEKEYGAQLARLAAQFVAMVPPCALQTVAVERLKSEMTRAAMAEMGPGTGKGGVTNHGHVIVPSKPLTLVAGAAESRSAPSLSVAATVSTNTTTANAAVVTTAAVVADTVAPLPNSTVPPPTVQTKSGVPGFLKRQISMSSPHLSPQEHMGTSTDSLPLPVPLPCSTTASASQQQQQQQQQVSGRDLFYRGTVHQGWLALLFQTEETAKTHLNLAEQLVKLRGIQLLADKDTERKNQLEFAQTCQNELRTAYKDLDHVRKEYQERSKKLSEAQASFTKIRENTKSSKATLDEAKAKCDKKEKERDVAEMIYQRQIDETNSKLKRYYKDLIPSVVDSLHSLEVERADKTKTLMEKALDVLEEPLQREIHVIKRASKQVVHMSSTRDFERLVVQSCRHCFGLFVARRGSVAVPPTGSHGTLASSNGVSGAAGGGGGGPAMMMMMMRPARSLSIKRPVSSTSLSAVGASSVASAVGGPTNPRWSLSGSFMNQRLSMSEEDPVLAEIVAVGADKVFMHNIEEEETAAAAAMATTAGVGVIDGAKKVPDNSYHKQAVSQRKAEYAKQLQEVKSYIPQSADFVSWKENRKVEPPLQRILKFVVTKERRKSLASQKKAAKDFEDPKFSNGPHVDAEYVQPEPNLAVPLAQSKRPKDILYSKPLDEGAILAAKMLQEARTEIGHVLERRNEIHADKITVSASADNVAGFASQPLRQPLPLLDAQLTQLLLDKSEIETYLASVKRLQRRREQCREASLQASQLSLAPGKSVDFQVDKSLSGSNVRMNAPVPPAGAELSLLLQSLAFQVEDTSSSFEHGNMYTRRRDAEALFDFEPVPDSDEMALQKGVKVIILEEEIFGGWTKAQLENGTVGFVPTSYLKV